MDVAGDAGTGGFADVHAEVDPVGAVEFAQNRFHALRKFHHLLGRSRGEFAQFIQMRVGDDHYMPRRVRKHIQDDEAMVAAMHDECFLVIAGVYGIAEDAGGCLLGGGDVCVAPGGPEIVQYKAG